MDYRSEHFPIEGAERHEYWYSFMLSFYLVQNPSLQSRVTHSQVFFFTLFKPLCLSQKPQEVCLLDHSKSYQIGHQDRLSHRTHDPITYQGSICERYCTRWQIFNVDESLGGGILSPKTNSTKTLMGSCKLRILICFLAAHTRVIT